MTKKQYTNNIGAEFHLSEMADNTMAGMNGQAQSEVEQKEETTPAEKNVSLQIKESLRTRLRLMSAKEDLKIQRFVERVLDAALAEKGY